MYLKGLDGIGKTFKPVIYSKQTDDEDISKVFVTKLEQIVKKVCKNYYKKKKQLIPTPQEQEELINAQKCHICNQELGKDRVRDHCHFTGEYRGAAHNLCNFKCQKPRTLPVIFHSLQGYDAHLFIKKKLAKVEGNLTCVPTTEEKYISFSKWVKVDGYLPRKTGKMASLNFEIRFIDSFKFMQFSLSDLVSNLDEEDFVNTGKIVREKFKLLTRKEVYPYDYVSSVSRFSETQLPLKSEFYSELNNEHISHEDYQHALTVWKTFKCKTIKDYHDLYLKFDVLLLADVFENFRKICLKHYKLDPAHYFTAPGIAWDVCLKKKTKQNKTKVTTSSRLTIC